MNYGIRLSCNRCGASKPLKRKAPTAGGGVVGFHQVDGVAGKLKWSVFCFNLFLKWRLIAIEKWFIWKNNSIFNLPEFKHVSTCVKKGKRLVKACFSNTIEPPQHHPAGWQGRMEIGNACTVAMWTFPIALNATVVANPNLKESRFGFSGFVARKKAWETTWFLIPQRGYVIRVVFFLVGTKS